MRHPEVIIVPFIFATIGFVFWVIVTGLQRRHQLKVVADFNSRLLDRIGSIKDFSEFLQTEGGARFMNSLTIDRRSGRPHEGIIRAVQIGIVVLVLGIGLLLTGDLGGFLDRESFIVLGAIGVSLGIGFLLSAAASYRIAKSLGVLG